MTSSQPNHSTEAATNRANLPDYRLDLPAITRQVRLCRSTLGAILDELDSGNRTPEMLDKLAECAMSVTAEIESLWEAVKQPS